MKKFLITLFILGVGVSTLLHSYGVIKGDFTVVIGAWVVLGVLCFIIYFINKALSLSFNSLTNAYGRKFKKRKLISKQDEDDAYQLVSGEIKNEAIDKATWARLYIKNKGDDKKTEIDYLEERVNQILDATEKQKHQTLIEKEKKKKEKANAIGCLVISVIIIIVIITVLNS